MLRPTALARAAILESLSVSIQLATLAGWAWLSDDLARLKHRASIEARRADDRDEEIVVDPRFARAG